MMTCRINRKNAGSRGVAIVIVLGLIAVLMMMAVAFSIHMRIERTGAANYRYGVQARHMVYAGLANAIRDIDGHMKDNAGKPLIFPDWDVAVSTQGTMKASVLSRASAEFIPEQLREVARKKEAKWNLIEDDNGIQRGRYAFVIVNSSGLLDANKVGGFVPRLYGSSSDEMRLDNVPGVTDHTQFVTRAMQDIRYENFPELIENNPHVGDGRSFSMFSLSPVKHQYDIDGPISNRVYIGADTSKWKPAEIIAAFADAGVPNPSLAYKNLVDYTDADSKPTDLAAGCVEKTPMINEIGLLCQLSRSAAGQLSGTVGLFVEWTYPFVTKQDKSYNLHYDVEVAEGPGNTITGCVPTAIHGSFDYGIPASKLFPMNFDSADKPGAFSGSATNDLITVDFNVKVSAYISEAGSNVDEVPSPYVPANGRVLTVKVPNLAKGASRTITNSWECLDPRFNWNPNSGVQWYSSAALSGFPGYQVTYRAENFITKVFFDPPAFGGPNTMDLDDNMFMHVGNRPLETLGELGYLCYDWWRTIRLYEHQGTPTPYPEVKKYHTVLDKFTIWTNDYRRGLVNINTTNLDLLASAFYGMPEEEYSTNRLTSWAGAQQIAQQIINKRPYTNLSELGKVQIDWDALTAGPTEICRESGIRNSAGMLTARDNFFTIIIRADSFSAGVGGNVGQGMTLATSRGVAEVWRDPIPDENGNHRSFVRSFRFVED